MSELLYQTRSVVRILIDQLMNEKSDEMESDDEISDIAARLAARRGAQSVDPANASASLNGSRTPLVDEHPHIHSGNITAVEEVQDESGAGEALDSISPIRSQRAAAMLALQRVASPANASTTSSNAPSTARKRRPLETYDTRVRGVPLHELVWAPHYGFRDRLFPGRIAKEFETSNCRWISWPIAQDDQVVELFSIPKAKENQYLVVKKESVLPYFACKKKGSDPGKYDDSERQVWNQSQMAAMKDAIRNVRCQLRTYLLTRTYSQPRRLTLVPVTLVRSHHGLSSGIPLPTLKKS